MSDYSTGEAFEGAISIRGSYDGAVTDKLVAYDTKPNDASPRLAQPSHPSLTPHTGSNKSQPLPLAPSVRREISHAIDSMQQAVVTMEIAHEGEGVDVAELANAIEDYRKSVNVLWYYRKFGMVSWQRVISLAVQAISENKRDEEMSSKQCEGLGVLVDRFLSNRHLVKDDIRSAMVLLRDSGFDTLASFSQQSP